MKNNKDQRSLEGNLTTRQRQALERKAHILEVAARLFSMHGVAGISTRQIALEAGVAEGLIFHYFADKSALFSAALEHTDTFPRHVARLLEGAEQRPAHEVLRELGHRWVKNAFREGAMLGMLLGEAQRHPEAAEVVKEVSGRSIERLAAYLTARIQAGELRADLPISTAATSFIAGLMVFLLMNQGLSEKAWKKLATVYVDELLSLWLQGARACSEPSAKT